MESHRLGVIGKHLIDTSDYSFSFQPVNGSPSPKRDDDVVICGAVRTAIGKAKRGSFKDTHWTDLLVAALKGLVTKTGIDMGAVEDVQVGTVLASGGGATEAKMALFAAGFPDTVALASTNRQCASGLQAFVNIASAIRSGFITVGIACGVESMSSAGMDAGVGKLNSALFASKDAADCLIPMGMTSENVAAKYNISREDQDKFAARSQNLAAAAQKAGLFKEEIVPVTVTIKKEDGTSEKKIVDQDDGIRATTVEQLGKLKPAFKKDGSTTAGNSSQVSDGAAAVLVMSRKEANKRGLKILGKFLSYGVAGVPPSIMGVGPGYAIPVALKNANLKVDDIDVFEINEAFASQALWSIQTLKIPLEKVNPNGGAIALGHPLGCTGARQIATLLCQLRRTKQRYGVISMCAGTGMGAAGVFEAEI
jgi:acetyl-CoA acyltransferase 1